MSQTDNKNVGLNNTEKRVLELLLLNPNENALSLCEIIGVSKELPSVH